MSDEDYYSLLGIDKNASDEEIRKAYKKKAKQFHPDLNDGDPTAEKKFQKISEAYEVLKDPQKKAAYDQYGHSAFQGGGGGGGFQPDDFSQNFTDIFDNLFNDFMGHRGGGGGSRQMQGEDIEYDVTVTLEDSYLGRDVSVQFLGTTHCSNCSGKGSNKEPNVCSACGGRGRIRARQGLFTVERTCNKCMGQGIFITDPCKVCNGEGRVHKDRTIKVKIPQGIEDGSRMRVVGEGGAGLRGGPSGDLYIVVHLEEHPIFKFRAPDLFCVVPVKFITVALGGSVRVPTIDGTITKVTIPLETQTGKQMRLKGKGLPSIRGGRHGDLYVELKVETPVKLTSKQKQLLEEFDQQAHDAKNHPSNSGFFEKVARLWGGKD